VSSLVVSGSCSISVDCICIPFGTSIRTHTSDKTVQFGPISLTANIYASVFIQGF
jgi:hypothetical protein